MSGGKSSILNRKVEIMALLCTFNEHNGDLCCRDHAHILWPLSHFVIWAITKFVLLILYIIITFLWATRKVHEASVIFWLLFSHRFHSCYP